MIKDFAQFQKRKGEGDNAAGPATENRGPPHRTTTELSNMAANIAADRRGQTQQTAETAVAIAADNNGDGGDFRNVQGGRRLWFGSVLEEGCILQMS